MAKESGLLSKPLQQNGTYDKYDHKIPENPLSKYFSRNFNYHSVYRIRRSNATSKSKVHSIISEISNLRGEAVGLWQLEFLDKYFDREFCPKLVRVKT